MVVTVLDAGADTSGSRRPEAVADPALAEGCHPRGLPVGGIASVESVREIGVLDLDGVACGGYPREEVRVPTHGGEGRVRTDNCVINLALEESLIQVLSCEPSDAVFARPALVAVFMRCGQRKGGVEQRGPCGQAITELEVV